MDTLEPRVLSQFSKSVARALADDVGLQGRFHFVGLDLNGAVIAGWCAAPDADPDDPAGDSGITIQYCPSGQLEMPIALTFVNRRGRVFTTSMVSLNQPADAPANVPRPGNPTATPPTPLRRPKR